MTPAEITAWTQSAVARSLECVSSVAVGNAALAVIIDAEMAARAEPAMAAMCLERADAAVRAMGSVGR